MLHYKNLMQYDKMLYCTSVIFDRTSFIKYFDRCDCNKKKWFNNYSSSNIYINISAKTCTNILMKY